MSWMGLLGGAAGGLLGGKLGSTIGGGSGKKWATALGGLGGAALGGYGATSAEDGGMGLFDATQPTGGQSMASQADMGNNSNFNIDSTGGFLDNQQMGQPPVEQGLFGEAGLKELGSGLAGAGNIYSSIAQADQSRKLLNLQKRQVEAALLNAEREKERQQQSEQNMSAGFGNYYYS